MKPTNQIRYKQWCAEEAIRRGRTLGSVQVDICNGRIKTPPLKRINKRVIWVRV